MGKVLQTDLSDSSAVLSEDTIMILAVLNIGFLLVEIAIALLTFKSLR